MTLFENIFRDMNILDRITDDVLNEPGIREKIIGKYNLSEMILRKDYSLLDDFFLKGRATIMISIDRYYKKIQ